MSVSLSPEKLFQSALRRHLNTGSPGTWSAPDTIIYHSSILPVFQIEFYLSEVRKLIFSNQTTRRTAPEFSFRTHSSIIAISQLGGQDIELGFQVPWTGSASLHACSRFQAYVYDIRSSGYLHKLQNFSSTVLSVGFHPAKAQVSGLVKLLLFMLPYVRQPEIKSQFSSKGHHFSILRFSSLLQFKVNVAAYYPDLTTPAVMQVHFAFIIQYQQIFIYISFFFVVKFPNNFRKRQNLVGKLLCWGHV